jgi:tetratricopeptide (TPR) repeat protein
MTADFAMSGSFSRWLYRPLIDLGEWQADGNVLLLGTELAARALSTGDDRIARLSASHFPSARTMLLQRVGLPGYLVRDPRQLPPGRRTPAWQLLCDHLDAYAELDPKARMRAVWVLHRLGLQEALLDCNQHPGDLGSAGLPDDDAALLYMRGFAKVILFYDGERDVETDDLQAVESLGRAGSWAHLQATYALAQLCVKQLNDRAGFERHLGRHWASIEASGATGHERNKLLSRYHRIRAFLPQLSGDLDGMSHEMDRAESYCDLLSRDDANGRAEWETLRCALLESRTKEMLVRGDYDAAERYALALVAHSPTDPRGQLELGQVRIEKGDLDGALDAYQQGWILGPHLAASAEFMIGQCLEKMGRLAEARNAYLRSLEADPLAISAVERLSEGNLMASQPHLARWAAQHQRYLNALDEGSEAAELQPYQQYGGVLGSVR